MKKSFVLYMDQGETFKALTDDQAGKLIKAIFEYNNGVNPKLDPLLSVVFIPIKQTLNRDTEKWDNIVKRNKQNIAKRWKNEAKKSLPEHTKNTSGKSGIPNTLDSDNDSDNDIHTSETIGSKEKYWDNHIKEVVSTLEGISLEVIKESRAGFLLYGKAKLTPGYMRGILKNKQDEYSKKGGLRDVTTFNNPFTDSGRSENA